MKLLHCNSDDLIISQSVILLQSYICKCRCMSGTHEYYTSYSVIILHKFMFDRQIKLGAFIHNLLSV